MRSSPPAALLSIFRCTACRSSLKADGQDYRCSACGREFPEIRKVVRFVDDHSYADSFSYQWERFSRTQLDPELSERNFRKKTGLKEEDLRGKLVLDVGCGMGRFADVATRWGARVVGIDLSEAAEVAARNLADREFIALQADVFSLPFAPASFDCIYSIGVLHHTPDCERACKNLVQYLRPGGSIAVWLYSGYSKWYRFSDHYRKITHRMPVQRLHTFLRVAVPFFYWLGQGLRAIPLAGPPMAALLQHVFPINQNPNPEIRVLDTLDWYSPKYQSKHTYEQVFRWFESCGVERLTVADLSIGVKGYNPAGNQGLVSSVKLDAEDTPNNFSAKTPVAPGAALKTRTKAMTLGRKTFRTLRWFPSYSWQRIARSKPRGHTHVMIALADHFEPAIVPEDGRARAPYHQQEGRLDLWCRDYALAVNKWRDSDGHPFVHTYFYPAEQYDKGLLERLASHCHAGWGEIEIHLHHGLTAPDSEENTRRQLAEFRDTLAADHGSLCYWDGVGPPRYAFVHGNFALANSAGGFYCGVDSEMQVLAETGCYADMTLPPGRFHSAHIAKINSLYECSVPLQRRGAHRRGRSLEAGRSPSVFPLMVEGPLMLRFVRPDGRRLIGIETGSLSSTNPPSLYRLQLWKKAAICVQGRPDWLFIKLQCHGMDPRDKETMLGMPLQRFLGEFVEGAAERGETLHFVSAREMVNIILAACDGREGNPGEYRDYRLKRVRAKPNVCGSVDSATVALKS